MSTVNMHEAKTHLSKLVEALVSGVEQEVVIARNGSPAVRMTAVKRPREPRLLGLAKGKFDFDDEAFKAMDAEIEQLFNDSADPWGEKLQR